jgi:hypothetical protein
MTSFCVSNWGGGALKVIFENFYVQKRSTTETFSLIIITDLNIFHTSSFDDPFYSDWGVRMKEES